MHDVADIGHVQAGGAEQQQNSGGDYGEQDTIHRPHADLKAGVRDPGHWVSGGKPGSLQQRGVLRRRQTYAEMVRIVPNERLMASDALRLSYRNFAHG